MNFIISGKNIEVTEGIRAAIEEKLGRLDTVSYTHLCIFCGCKGTDRPDAAFTV